jgi:steroid delta-isomerase-like uncharacterized protein
MAARVDWMLEANKRILVRHFDEVLNQGKLDVIDEIYADGYVLDAPVRTEGSVAEHGQTHGRDGLRRRVTSFRTAFPDIAFAIDEMVCEGDRVAVRYAFTGTHRGRFGDLEPTGRTIAVSGILIAHLDDGRIVSAVSVFDSGDLLRQLEPDRSSPVRSLIEVLVGRIHRHDV